MNHLYALRKFGQGLFQLWGAHEKSNYHQETSFVPDPIPQFQKHRQNAVTKGEKALSVISEALKRGERSCLELRLEQLSSSFDLVQLVDEAIRLLENDKPPAPEANDPAVPAYLVSSWFLAECAAHLLGNPHGHERLHLVTGIKVSPKCRTLERMVQVALASQSPVHAIADQHDLLKTLIEIDERWGHALYGLFHSHPGRGAHATRPSRTDLDTHQLYEQGGYPLVGAIFVKDFVRFFANRPFTITIHGKGVTQIDEHVFSIRNLSH